MSKYPPIRDWTDVAVKLDTEVVKHNGYNASRFAAMADANWDESRQWFKGIAAMSRIANLAYGTTVSYLKHYKEFKQGD